MSDAQPEQSVLPTLPKKEEMTPTANKLYALYEQARAIFRATESKAAEEEVKVIEDVASDTKTDD